MGVAGGCVTWLNLSPVGELQAMSVAVMGPIYPDDSLEEAPSPLEVAAMFHPSRPSSQPLVLPCVHSHPR